MANEQGMFGLTPYQAQEQERQRQKNSAVEYAKLDPFQRANMGIYSGAAGMVGGIGGMLGYQTPAVRQAEQRQAIGQGMGNMKDPQSWYAASEKARIAGNADLADKLAARGNALEKDIAGRTPKIKTETQSVVINAQDAEGEDQLMKQDYYSVNGVVDTSRPVGQPYPLYSPKSDVSVTVGGKQQTELESSIGQGLAKDAFTGRAAANDASAILNTIAEGRKILDDGMVTGFGADFIVGFDQFLKKAGFNFGGNASANSQTYVSQMANNVGKLIKQFGSGTGLSDQDRIYAQRMAGAEITLDEQSLRKILFLGDKYARMGMRQHNKFIDKLNITDETKETLKVYPASNQVELLGIEPE
jgi:hypothetical protein